MAAPYTKQMLCERIQKHMNNGFPNGDWGIDDDEIILYIDEAVPVALRGQMFENAKVTGVLDTPEAYITTYELPALSYNTPTRAWYSTLPVLPLGLPAGYNINDLFFASDEDGRSFSVYIIKTKRLPFRQNMPKPSGVFAWVEGNKIYAQHNEGASLLSYTLYSQMPTTRTGSITDVMLLPDDAVDMVFKLVVNKLKERLGLPQDVIKDNLPQGNKTS